MFVILTYDVNQKRVSKVMKICRKYLTHVQRSVFEGMITEGQMKRLKKEIESQIEVQEDSVRIYMLDNLRYTCKEEIGKSLNDIHVM